MHSQANLGSRPLTTGQADELPLGRDARLLLLLIGLLTLITGAVLFLLPAGMGVGAIDQASGRPAGNQLWPWSLRTPLNSRFFGAFFLSIGVGALFGLREPTWERVRVLFPSGITFTALGTLAIVLHRASFPPARLATWLFVAIYIAALLAEILVYVRYERHRAG